jgi:hypothetical protein
MISNKFLFRMFLALFISFTIESCGTLGGFDQREFPLSYKIIEKNMDSILSQFPNYNIPEKWKKENDWSKRGYDFLESRIFYFSSAPEEMYYVTFVGDSAELSNPDKCRFAVRAVYNDSAKTWILNSQVSKEEKKRIETRFDNEIILKLEKLTGKNVSY